MPWGTVGGKISRIWLRKYSIQLPSKISEKANVTVEFATFTVTLTPKLAKPVRCAKFPTFARF